MKTIIFWITIVNYQQAVVARPQLPFHGETFDLPSGAIRLARRQGCENQALQFGRSVIGLQFHLETTPESARVIVKHCRNELLPSEYIQTESEILGVVSEKYESINDLMDRVLSFLGDTDG